MKTVVFPFQSQTNELIYKVIIDKNGILVFPTETFYAIGCSALNSEAIQRIYSIKNREINKPLLLLVSDWEMLSKFVEPLTVRQKHFLFNFWPGALTVLLPVEHGLSQTLNRNHQKIGFRITSSPIAKKLIQICDVPIVGTSANISGSGAVNNIKEVQATFGKGVDLYVDGGKTSGGSPSTVIEFSTMKSIRILREGVIPSRSLYEHADRILNN